MPNFGIHFGPDFAKLSWWIGSDSCELAPPPPLSLIGGTPKIYFDLNMSKRPLLTYFFTTCRDTHHKFYTDVYEPGGNHAAASIATPNGLPLSTTGKSYFSDKLLAPLMSLDYVDESPDSLFWGFLSCLLYLIFWQNIVLTSLPIEDRCVLLDSDHVSIRSDELGDSATMKSLNSPISVFFLNFTHIFQVLYL